MSMEEEKNCFIDRFQIAFFSLMLSFCLIPCSLPLFLPPYFCPSPPLTLLSSLLISLSQHLLPSYSQIIDNI